MSTSRGKRKRNAAKDPGDEKATAPKKKPKEAKETKESPGKKEPEPDATDDIPEEDVEIDVEIVPDSSTELTLVDFPLLSRDVSAGPDDPNATQETFWTTRDLAELMNIREMARVDAGEERFSTPEEIKADGNLLGKQLSVPGAIKRVALAGEDNIAGFDVLLPPIGWASETEGSVFRDWTLDLGAPPGPSLFLNSAFLSTLVVNPVYKGMMVQAKLLLDALGECERMESSFLELNVPTRDEAMHHFLLASGFVPLEGERNRFTRYYATIPFPRTAELVESTRSQPGPTVDDTLSSPSTGRSV